MTEKFDYQKIYEHFSVLNAGAVFLRDNDEKLKIVYRGIIDDAAFIFDVDSSYEEAQEMVQGFICGGDKAIRHSVEGAEDNADFGYEDDVRMPFLDSGNGPLEELGRNQFHHVASETVYPPFYPEFEDGKHLVPGLRMCVTIVYLDCFVPVIDSWSRGVCISGGFRRIFPIWGKKGGITFIFFRIIPQFFHNP